MAGGHGLGVLRGVAVALVVLGPTRVLSCSRVLFNARGYPTVSARTMDWIFPFNDSLLVNPRGVEMDGGLGSMAASKTWIAKYGSVVSSINTWLSTLESSFTGKKFDYIHDGGTDGLNEAGFGAHLLYLEATRYGTLRNGSQGVAYTRVVRYLLDTCATVKEAVVAMESVHVADVKIRVSPDQSVSLGCHVAVEDAFGDSAIFEFMDGELRVYHGRNYTVMTNDPPIPEQIANLKRYLPFTRITVPPGDIASTARFVRLAYFLNYVPRTLDSTRLVAEMRSVITTAAAPMGAPADDDPELGVYPTWWISLMDYEQGIYYWGWMMNPNFIWVEMSKLKSSGKLAAGSPTLYLDPLQVSLVGEVSGSFRPTSDSSSVALIQPVRRGLQAFSATLLGCVMAVGLLGTAFFKLSRRYQQRCVHCESARGLLA